MELSLRVCTIWYWLYTRLEKYYTTVFKVPKLGLALGVPPPAQPLQRGSMGKQKFDASRDLRLAAGSGDLEALSKEISTGVDVDLVCPESGFHAMHYAALNAHVECVKELLKAGAAHSTYTKAEFAAGSQLTPLDYAKRYVHPKDPSKTRHPEVVDLLLAAGAAEGIHVDNAFEVKHVGGDKNE